MTDVGGVTMHSSEEEEERAPRLSPGFVLQEGGPAFRSRIGPWLTQLQMRGGTTPSVTRGDQNFGFFSGSRGPDPEPGRQVDWQRFNGGWPRVEVRRLGEEPDRQLIAHTT